MGYRYALVGNPNCGKTTLFNSLTGSNQYVGNWPGVTVEKKEGKLIRSNGEVSVVDLPGIYSLSPYSAEEIVSRNYIINEKPDLIINIVDATNLERNLYLSLQLAELGVPMIIALNMMDVIEKSGDTIDVALLSALLGIKVIPISATKSTNVHKLISACEHEIEHHAENSTHIDIHSNQGAPPNIYVGRLLTAIKEIEGIIEYKCMQLNLPLRWCAVKLIEGDSITYAKLELNESEKEIIEEIVKRIETRTLDREMLVADQKYKYICKVRNQVLKSSKKEGMLTTSDKIDRIVTNKYLAIPLFLGIMVFVFYITFGSLGSNLTDLVDNLINVRFIDVVRGSLESISTPSWAVALLCDGIITGVGSVLSFFPQLAILFFFLSLLEDSGYMARAAFIMDKALHVIGLSGKSFVPMLMGFGCTVPAVMATRTLSNEKDRRLTIMLLPFMSCGAKMPIYALFIGSFFSKYTGITISSIYLLGLIVAVISAYILQKTVLKGGHAPFVMELPQYRMPTAKTLFMHLWEKIWDFLTKAGTILLGASVIIWFLQYFNFSFTHVLNSEESMLGLFGKAIAPIFSPLGFGDWKSSVSVLSGLVAKESIVSTMGILHNTSSEGLTTLMQSIYTPPAAYAIMVYTLLFIPCFAAVAAIKREMASAKWTLFALAFQAVVAWVVTFIIYQVGNLIWVNMLQ
ncbi:MAG TPA: ferrous iron transport protein B [Clostridia bacterium]|nr:ferrous iron transport protein B [Clostridia bacterium]